MRPFRFCALVTFALTLASCGGSSAGSDGNGGAAGVAGSGATGGTGATGGVGASGGAGATGGAGASGGGTGATGGSGGGCAQPTEKPVNWTSKTTGTPPFKALEAHAFIGLGGVAPSYASSVGTLGAVFGTRHVFSSTGNYFAPGAPHAPPYTNELADGIKAANFVSASEFAACHLDPPSALFFVLLLGPADNAPTGKTLDFASGPIMPMPTGQLYVIDGDTLRDGVVIDPNFDSQYWPPQPGEEGYSHIVLGFATSTDFIPAGTPVTGTYLFRVKVTADSGEVQIDVPYVVK